MPNKKHEMNKNKCEFKDKCQSIFNSLISSQSKFFICFLADNIILTHTQNLLDFHPSAMKKTSCGILIGPCPVPIKDSV